MSIIEKFLGHWKTRKGNLCEIMIDKLKWSQETEYPIRMIDGKVVLTMNTADYLGTLNENQDSIFWDDGDVWERELVKNFLTVLYYN